MDYKLLLNTNSNFREIEAEEQNNFVLSVIQSLDLSFEWDTSQKFSVEDKLRLRKFCSQYNIAIVEEGRESKVYLEGKPIADWKKPSYILREDLGQVDPRKRLYMEMTCSFSSIFEDDKK